MPRPSPAGVRLTLRKQIHVVKNCQPNQTTGCLRDPNNRWSHGMRLGSLYRCGRKMSGSQCASHAQSANNDRRSSRTRDAGFVSDVVLRERNVFVIMSFDSQLLDTSNAIQASLQANGYTALRANMKTYGDARQLWDNLITYMDGCNYGIAGLEDRSANEFNPNVTLE
jgi:hypothetical protein